MIALKIDSTKAFKLDIFNRQMKNEDVVERFKDAYKEVNRKTIPSTNNTNNSAIAKNIAIYVTNNSGTIQFLSVGPIVSVIKKIVKDIDPKTLADIGFGSSAAVRSAAPVSNTMASNQRTANKSNLWTKCNSVLKASKSTRKASNMQICISKMASEQLNINLVVKRTQGPGSDYNGVKIPFEKWANSQTDLKVPTTITQLESIISHYLKDLTINNLDVYGLVKSANSSSSRSVPGQGVSKFDAKQYLKDKLKTHSTPVKPTELNAEVKLFKKWCDENGKQFINDLEKIKPVIDEYVNTITASNFIQMGFSRWSSGGNLTDVQEAYCMLMIAVLANNKAIKSPDDVTIAQFQNAYERCKTDKSNLNSILEGINDEDKMSSFLQAEKIVNDNRDFVKRGCKIYIDKDPTAAWIKTEGKKRLNKAFNNIGYGNPIRDVNKFNTADFYIINSSGGMSSIKSELMQEKTIFDYNDKMLEFYNNRKLVPVSLKKINKSAQKLGAAIKEINVTADYTSDLTNVKFLGWMISQQIFAASKTITNAEFDMIGEKGRLSIESQANNGSDRQNVKFGGRKGKTKQQGIGTLTYNDSTLTLLKSAGFNDLPSPQDLKTFAINYYNDPKTAKFKNKTLAEMLNSPVFDNSKMSGVTKISDQTLADELDRVKKIGGNKSLWARAKSVALAYYIGTLPVEKRQFLFQIIDEYIAGTYKNLGSSSPYILLY